MSELDETQIISMPAASIRVSVVRSAVDLEAGGSSVRIDCGSGEAAVALASAMSRGLARVRWSKGRDEAGTGTVTPPVSAAARWGVGRVKAIPGENRIAITFSSDGDEGLPKAFSLRLGECGALSLADAIKQHFEQRAEEDARA